MPPPAVVAGIDRELAALEQRLQAAIDEFPRRLAAVQLGREFDDERRLQRAVEDQARIALDLGDVVAVVMDAVAVEGQRRITKQQHGIGEVALAMLRRRRRGRRLWRHLRPAGRLAIDDVVALLDRDAARRGDDVIDRDEAQRAGRAGLQIDVRDRRGALDLVADAHRLDEFQFAAGPHPARQRHRRQEAAAGRVAVLAQLRHRKHRRRQAPMRGEGRGVARLRLPISWNSVARKPLTRCAVTTSVASSVLPIHCRKMIDVGLFARDGRSTHDDFLTGCALGNSWCWPMSGTAPYRRGSPTKIAAGAA